MKVKCPVCNQTLFFGEKAELEIKCKCCRKVISVTLDNDKLHVQQKVS